MSKSCSNLNGGRVGVACHYSKAGQRRFFGASASFSASATTPRVKRSVVDRGVSLPFPLYSTPHEGSMEIVGNVVAGHVVESNRGKRITLVEMQRQYERELAKEVKTLVGRW